MTFGTREAVIFTARQLPAPMKRPQAPVLILAITLFALVVTGRAQQRSVPATQVDTQAHAPVTEAIVLPRQTLTFKTARNDISVGGVIFTLYQPLATNVPWLD